MEKSEIESSEVEPWRRTVTIIKSHSNEKCVGYLVNIKSLIIPEKFDKATKEHLYTIEINGVKWTLVLYPLGYNYASNEYVSFYIRLQHTAPVTVNILMSDNDVVSTQKITHGSYGWGIDKWKKREDNKLIEVTVILQYTASQNSESVDPPTSLSYYPWNVHDLTHHLYSKIHNIKLQGKGWVCYAHKEVLSQVSPVFEAMLKNPMKELLEGRIKVEDVSDRKVIEEMLHFIYTGRMEHKNEEIIYEICQQTHKYSIDSFALACDHQLCLHRTVENVSDKLVLATLYNLKFCKKVCSDFIAANYKDVVKTEGWERLIENKDSTLYITRHLADISIAKP